MRDACATQSLQPRAIAKVADVRADRCTSALGCQQTAVLGCPDADIQGRGPLLLTGEAPVFQRLARLLVSSRDDG